MSSFHFKTPSPARSAAGSASPLRAKPVSPLNPYDKENQAGPDSPRPPRSRHQNSKVSHRLSLPMGISNYGNKSPFRSQNQAASGSNRPVPRRGRVTDGGAISSLINARIGDTSERRTTEKRPASVEELDDSPSAAKRPRRENGEPPLLVENRSLADAETKKHGSSSAPVTKNTEGVSSTAPVLRGHRGELLVEPSYPSIDAQFDALWDEVTRRTAAGASEHTRPADVFDNEDVFRDWHDGLPSREDREDRRERVGQSSRRSGDVDTTHIGGLLQEEDRVDALGATAVPDANDFDFEALEAQLPTPLALALRAYRGLTAYAEHHPLVPRLPIPQQGAPDLLVAPTPWLPRAESPPPADVPELKEAMFIPAVEENPVAAPEATTKEDTEAEKTVRKPRAARIRPEARRQKAPSPLIPEPTSREVISRLPRSLKAQGTQLGKVTSTGRMTRSTRAQSNAPEQGAPISPSRPPVTLAAIPEAPQPPKAKGTKSTRPRQPARRARGSQAPPSGMLGSSITGPSTSTPIAQGLYTPALAQQIWDLAEAGKWHKALDLFHPEHKSRHIEGEAAVRAYLDEHPEAEKDLRPLTNGGPRENLFLCRSRTFWVPTEEPEGEKTRPRQFVLEHHAEDCVKGYASVDNYNKHLYSKHFKKKYKAYSKKDDAKGQTTSAKSKGKTRQATGKSKAPKKEEDEYRDEDEEDNED